MSFKYISFVVSVFLINSSAIAGPLQKVEFCLKDSNKFKMVDVLIDYQNTPDQAVVVTYPFGDKYRAEVIPTILPECMQGGLGNPIGKIYFIDGPNNDDVLIQSCTFTNVSSGIFVTNNVVSEVPLVQCDMQ